MDSTGEALDEVQPESSSSSHIQSQQQQQSPQSHHAALPLRSQPSTSAESEEHLICRVCRGDEGHLYYPCLCTGSIKYVHQECLTEWLKYSKKEVCELCNYRYSFQPIYKEDMPKALPISEIAEGIWWSLVGMVKTWLLYTLVLVSWLGIVPITAARIYHTVFYSPFHDLFLVPFRLFHTDHLIADIGKGSLLIVLFVCAFISLLWLREQIVLGGPQDFLNIPDAAEEEQLNIAENEEYAGESGSENGDEDMQLGENEVEEFETDEEGGGNAEEEQINRMNREQIEQGENQIGEEPFQAAQAGQQERVENWRDLDRLEEFTWQRLIGLDGSLAFLEYVLWAISLSIVFTVFFAFSPYKVGSFFLNLLGILPKIHYFPSIASILTGYVTVALIIYGTHYVVQFFKLKTLYRLLGICFLILKVFLLVLIEIGFFPIICGCWMDLCSLTLFSTTLSSRIASFSASPTAFVFVRWMTGMVYVFYSASFVVLLREVLRPGVLFFLRNLNDPDFNPIQEMIELPVSRHLRRLIASTSLFFLIIMLILFVPLSLIQRFMPSFLPYNVSFSADIPFSELSLELLVLQVVMPALLEQTNSRVYLKVLIRVWCVYVGRLLSLEEYLLSDNRDGQAENEPQAGNRAEQNAEEDGNANVNVDADEVPQMQPQAVQMQPAAGDNPVAQEGGLGAEHQALLLLREPRQDKPYARPAYFALRIIALICILAFSWCVSALVCLTLPVSIGRYVIFRLTNYTNVHELYTVAIGLYVCWLVGKCIAMVYSFLTESNAQLKQLILQYLSIACRCFVVAIPIVFVIPYLLGTYFQLVAITPIRLTYRQNQTPIFFPWQDWTMGILHVKIFCAAVLSGPDWWMKAAFEQVYQDGLMDLHATRILTQLVLPISLCLSTLIAAPICLTYIGSRLFEVPHDQSIGLLFYSYPVLLFVLLAGAFLQWQMVKLRDLAEKIKNDKYLIGTQLVNYERNAASAAAQNAAASAN